MSGISTCADNLDGMLSYPSSLPPSPQKDEPFQASRLKAQTELSESVFDAVTLPRVPRAPVGQSQGDTPAEHSAAERG